MREFVKAELKENSNVSSLASTIILAHIDNGLRARE
jgi:hypothetical protein